jgi:hypothetical protein
MPQPDPSISPCMQKYYKLRRHLGVDLIELDHAFMVTPTILQDVGELAAEANRDEAVAKHNLDIAKGEAAERLRATRVGISEARLSTMVPLDDDVKSARQAVELAMFESSICTALYKSFEAQWRMVNKAADMIIAGYVNPEQAHMQRRAEINQARRAAQTLEKPLVRPS